MFINRHKILNIILVYSYFLIKRKESFNKVIFNFISNKKKNKYIFIFILRLIFVNAFNTFMEYVYFAFVAFNR